MVKRDIRLATFSDEAVMLEWVNSADSLNWKKNTKSKISKKTHEQWFNTRLTDKNTKIWIILHDDVPSGQVRLEKKAGCVYTDIYVVAAVRRTGLASFALNESIKRYSKLYGSKKFCAVIHPKNEMSEKLFLKNGFYQDKEELGLWLKLIRVLR